MGVKVLARTRAEITITVSMKDYLSVADPRRQKGPNDCFCKLIGLHVVIKQYAFLRMALFIESESSISVTTKTDIHTYTLSPLLEISSRKCKLKDDIFPSIKIFGGRRRNWD